MNASWQTTTTDWFKDYWRWGFNQLVHEGTHIQGRHIDHAYLLDPNGKVNPIVERYSPYYTDHDGICITLTSLDQWAKHQSWKVVVESSESKIDSYIWYSSHKETNKKRLVGQTSNPNKDDIEWK